MTRRRAWQLSNSCQGLCLLLLFAAQLCAAAPHLPYTCQPVPQEAGACGTECQRRIGSALLQLYAGLAGPGHSQPWHRQTAYTLCRDHCHAVPAYCGWPGVLCCHSRNDSRPHQTGNCRMTDVEHDMCSGTASHGSVWKLDLRMQNLQGTLSKEVIHALKVLTGFGLHTIDFSSNRISGSIPDGMFESRDFESRDWDNLTTVNLNFNRLTGTIPPSIAKLPGLKHLYLSFNRLTGNLHKRFCTRTDDPLQVLILRSNMLNGTADFTACTNLLLLDLTDNQLTGSLPVGIQNDQLISLRVTNNRLTGSISDEIWKLPLLTTIDLGNNRLTGTLSDKCGRSSNLVNIYLGNNSLSGTLPDSVVSNSQMLVLELQNNTSLHGTFPSTGGLVGLRQLDIHNTSIKGTIPAEWGQLRYLEFVDISGTRMSCCETQEQADDPGFRKLPPFLMFSNRYSQFDLNIKGGSLVEETDEGIKQPNNILCRTVVRNPAKYSAPNMSDWEPSSNAVVQAQRWQLSPLYFWFKDCTCTKFYDMTDMRYRYQGVDSWCDETYNCQVLTNVTPRPCFNMSIFYCHPLPIVETTLKPSVRAAIAVAAFLTTAVVLTVIGYLMLAKASKFRRSLMLSAIRLKGPPRHGRMSLVVTDIEGYSDIFRRSPEVMFKALVLHNTVLRAAKYHNGGFVLEQEGDSFTIAFYDPFDAVVFCLQAQQALMEVQWPVGLEQEPDRLQHTDSTASRKGSKLHLRLSPLLGFGPRMKRVGTNTSTRSVGSNVDYGPSFFHHTLLSGFGSRGQLEEPLLFHGLRVRMGVVTGEVPSGTAIKNSALFQLAKVVGDFGNGGQVILDESTFAAIKDDSQALGAVEASGLNHRKLSSGRSTWNRLLRLFGCVGPHIPAEEVVMLDMGAFCQTPGDEDAALPYTTSHALDVKAPEGSPYAPNSPRASRWLKFMQPCSPCCGTQDGDVSGDMSDSSPRQGPQLPPAAQLSRPYLGSVGTTGRSRASSGGATGPLLAALAASSLSLRSLSSFTRSTATSLRPGQGDDQQQDGPGTAPKQDTVVIGRLASFSARATTQWAQLRKTLTRSQSFQGTQPTRRDWESVRLYQVLAPALAGRAHTWHNQLNVKDGWICWDNIYFEAPGSTYAPLTGGSIDALTSGNSCNLPATITIASPGSQDGSTHTAASTAADSMDSTNSNPCLCPPSLLPLPPVTMVFMAVEGPDQLVRRRRTFTPVVQSLLSRVVRDALRRLGGYLCRVQEGDMKFMVVFASPVTALEWCVLVQVAAMYLPWPQSAIMLLPSCREQVDSTGRLVFRGPRLKMGVCEGVPRSILPDHEGRADYHGQSINMAARFMDKGARGGQIACTRELAEQVLAVWAAGGRSSTNGLHPGTHSIAEDDTGTLTDTAAGVAAGGTLPSSGNGSRGVSTGVLQPLDIELPSEQAAAVAAAAAAVVGAPRPTASSSGSGPGSAVVQTTPQQQPHRNSSSSNVGSVSRFIWNSSKAPAAASAAADAQQQLAPTGIGPNSGPLSTPFDKLKLCSSNAAAAGPAEASASINDLIIVSDDAAAAACSTTWAVQSADGEVNSCPDGGQLIELQGAHTGSGSGATAAAAGSGPTAQDSSSSSSCSQVRPSLARVAGGSWPGGLSGGQQPAKQRAQPLHKGLPGLAAQLWLSHSRTSEGSSHMQRGPPSRLNILTSPRSAHGRSASSAVPSLLLPNPTAPPPPPVVAPSPFVLAGVERVPLRVEVHRLGLYRFKGGPSLQEMVQILPTHLLGRAEFLAADAAAPASRKGQLLQRLEGRVKEPVMVPLPGLAQEYLENLPNRVSGTSGLPHLCTATATSAAAGGGGGHQQLVDAGARQTRALDAAAGTVWGRGSRSMTLPARTSFYPVGPQHPLPSAASAGVIASGAAAGLAAYPAGQQQRVYTHTGMLPDEQAVQQQVPQEQQQAGTPPSGHDVCSQAYTTSSLDLGAADDAGQLQGNMGPVVQGPGKAQHSVVVPASSPAAAKGATPASPTAAAGASAVSESCVVNLPAWGLRHDSFKSVADDDGAAAAAAAAAGSNDEEVGLAAAVRSKSDPLIPLASGGASGP